MTRSFHMYRLCMIFFEKTFYLKIWIEHVILAIALDVRQYKVLLHTILGFLQNRKMCKFQRKSRIELIFCFKFYYLKPKKINLAYLG